MKLYELTAELSALDSFDLETDDDIQAYADLYAGLGGAIADKIQGVCMVIRNASANVDALREEIDRMVKKARSAENRINRLKEYMQINLESMGMDNVETALFSVRIQSNPPSVDIICPADQLPSEYQRVKIEAYKTAIKDALKAGTEINGCSLIQTKSLRIK